MLLLHKTLILLLLISIPSTIYLYLYPLFHGCDFPTKNAFVDVPGTYKSNPFGRLTGSGSPAHLIAPFRLLALGDPQLEGDSSIRNPQAKSASTLGDLQAHLLAVNSWQERVDLVAEAARKLFLRDLPAALQAWRKQLDLIGNDYYLAHIYRVLGWYTKPTHVTVLGDLLGSQWVNDDEFQRRSSRFWHRAFRHGQKVEQSIMDEPTEEILGQDKRWEKRIINIVGNHDVGYAGDMTVEKVNRFERLFGKVNWEITFRLPHDVEGTVSDADKMEPRLRIIVLNSMNLDSPAKDTKLQEDTYRFMNEIITRSQPVEDRKVGTILLTHIPLEKMAGVCVDSPFFDFHTNGPGGLKEQNHISYEAGKGILEGIYGMSGNPNVPGEGFGRHGIILTGHDHEGCDVYHHLPRDEEANSRRWNATRWEDAASLLREPIPGIREITVRSMMGDFGGNAGLLSAWFDYDIDEWQFAFDTCAVGVQHIWWTVHILVLVTAGLLSYVCITTALDTPSARIEHGKGRIEKEVAKAAGTRSTWGSTTGKVAMHGSTRRRKK